VTHTSKTANIIKGDIIVNVQLTEARWPTILLCKLQVLQHLEKITWLLCVRVSKLGTTISINTLV